MTTVVRAHVPWAVRGLFAVALVFAVREARVLLAPVVIAVVLTFVLAPGVRWLRRRGLREAYGAGLLVLLLLASVVGMAAGLAEPAAQWWEKAPSTVSQLVAQFDRMRHAVPGLAPAPAPPPAKPTPRGAPTPPPPPADPVKERLVSEGVALTGVVLEHSLAFAISAAATVILLYFLLTSERWMLSRCVEAIPRRRARALLLSGVRAAQREMAHYLFALGCINAGVGALTGLALWSLGLPNPVLWAVIVAVLNYVPYLGPLLAMAMLLLAGMVSFADLQAMLAPAGAFALIHVIESNLFSPWVVGRRLALSPLSVLLSVMFWGWLWGIAGALIAVPTLITAHNLFRRNRRLRPWARFLEGDFNAPPPLRVLLRARPQLRVGPLRRSRAAPARGADEAERSAQRLGP